MLQSSLDPVKKAQQLLGDRFPVHRVRHKPLSILRQEARRALEMFLDAEFPALVRADRDRLILTAIDESASMGPLEELYRDESVLEFMILAFNQIVVRKAENWLPSSVRFRDELAWESYRKRLVATAEHYVGVSQLTAGFDLRLSNGFRAVGVLPPPGLNLPGLVVLSRGAAATSSEPTANAIPITAATVSSDSESSIMSNAELMRALPNGANGSSVRLGVSDVIRQAGSSRPTTANPTDALKQKVAERIIRKCAAAGVFDLKVIPRGELQKVIFASVEELAAADNLALPDQTKNILTLEILSGMRP